MASQPQIEGTILTEGVGTGRGTRFALPAADRRLNTGGQERGISGGKGGIDPSAARRLSAAGAQVNAQPLDTLKAKPLITNGSGADQQTINSVGDVLSNAVFKYAERVNDAQADEAVLQFNEFARTSYFGDTEKGDFGFSGLKGQAAVDARTQFFSAVDDKMTSIISGLDPEVKQKAMSRLYSIRDTTLNRASGHIAQEQSEYEQQLQYRKAEDLTRELVYDTTRVTELKDGFAQLFGTDFKGMSEHWDQAVIVASNARYDDAKQRGKNAMEALKGYREDVKDTISKKALVTLDSYIEAQQHEEENEQHRKEVAARKAWTESADRSYAKGLGKIFEKPGDYTTINDLLRLVPEAAEDHTLLNMLINQRDDALKDPREKQNNILDARDRMYQLGLDAVVIPNRWEFDKQFASFGLGPKELGALYNEHLKPLQQDEKTLKQNYLTAVKSIDKALNTNSIADFFGGFQTKPGEGPQAPGSDVVNYAQALKMKLQAAAQDQTVSPAQRHANMEEVLRLEVEKINGKQEDAGPEGMLGFPMDAFETLGETYRVQQYAALLQQNENKMSGNWVDEPIPQSKPEEGLPQLNWGEADYIKTNIGTQLGDRAQIYDAIQQVSPGASQVRFLYNGEVKNTPEGMERYTGYAVLYPLERVIDGKTYAPGWYAVNFKLKK